MVIERFSDYADADQIKDLKIIKWQIGDGPTIVEVD